MNKKIPIFLGIILVFIAIWILITPFQFIRSFMDRLNALGYDLQLHTHVLAKPKQQDFSVIIVDIDDKSLKAEGRWPWSRNKVASLVDELQAQGAAVIAFDIFFSEKERNIALSLAEKLAKYNHPNQVVLNALKKDAALFDDDNVLAASLKKTSSILAIGFLPRNQTDNILPPPLFKLNKAEADQLNIIKTAGYISNIPVLQQASKSSGFINIFADRDGIIRRAPLLLEYEDGVYPSLSLQAVLSYLDTQASLVTASYNKIKKLEGIKIGNIIIPTDERGQVLIPFAGKSYTLPYISATDVLKHAIPQNILLGKIVFIGTSATGLGDLQATSIQSPFPGVEIQATLANALIKNNFSYVPAWTFGANLFLTTLLGMLAAFIFPYLGPRTLGIIIIAFAPIMLFLNNWIWVRTGLILSFVTPVSLVSISALLNIIYGYLFETRKREHLKEMFGQYVPEEHIDEMLKSKDSYGLHGEDRKMSVLFADIRNFTTISESLSATELVDMLNTFFTPMTEIIFKYKGTIDKYVGDLIMAFWGAPLDDKLHSRHAIQAALKMQSKLKELKAGWKDKNWPDINIGIGINSGDMSVGDMGSRYRRNYTVLGDEVNLASRVEGLTKFYGVNILVTENTQHNNQSRFIFRKIDVVRVKGKKKGVAIYEVLGRKSELSPALETELATYHQALTFYFEQKWEQAFDLLSQLSAEFPETKIYKIYLDRISEFKLNPLPSDWDGVYVHMSK